MQVQVNEYLTWQRAQPLDFDEPAGWKSCPIEQWEQPVPVKSCLPDWYINLRANLKTLDPATVSQDRDILQAHGYRSAKLCLGLRGIRTVGWTIPLTHDMTCPAQYPCHDGNVGRQEITLHPAMLHGSGFDTKHADQTYEWQLRIVSFPWRAVMASGWRMLITAHPLTWSNDWFCFSGCVDANYKHDGVNINNFWNFAYPIDPNLNYYNIEIVVAIRTDCNRTVTAPAGTCLFSLVPIYDPDYQPAKFKKFPDFGSC